MTAADRPTEPPVECVAVDRDERCLCPGGPASHRPSSPAPAAGDGAVLDRKPVRNHPDVESPAPNVATSEGRDKAVATSGEQPGPLKAGVMALTGLSSDEVDALGGVREDDRPAPAVPDSTGLRERLWEAIVKVRDAAPRLPDDADTDDIVDAVLAVVGQGVTAAEARAEAERRFQHPDAGAERSLHHWFTEGALWASAVVGQGCNCGFGGQHDPANPRCRVNDPTEAWLRSSEQGGE